MTNYVAVNEMWPRTLPPVTREEAERASRKLYQKFGRRKDALPIRHSFDMNMGCPPRVRKSWINSKPQSVVGIYSYPRGWHELVHDISHDVHEYRHPSIRPHGSFHSKIEQEIITYVLAQGWLGGILRAKEKTKPSLLEKRIEALSRTQALIRQWESKQKRATNALKKLRVRARQQTRARDVEVANPTPPKPIVPRAERPPRESTKKKAERLAEQYGISLDFFERKQTVPNMVYPPSDLYPDETTDPYHDDHSVADWKDVLERVEAYVGEATKPGHPDLV